MCDISAISTYTPYITAIGGVLAGGFGSYFVGVKLSQRNHANALALAERSEFNKAATEFRCAFIDELCKLEDSIDGPPGFTFDIIKDAFPKHFKAYITFRSTLPESESQILTKKWEYYCEVEDKQGVMLPSERKDCLFAKYVSSSREEDRTKRQLAIQDINSMFSLH
jgi:hypothetical protein